MEKTQYKVIENFLPLKVFTQISKFMIPDEYMEGEQRIEWFYSPNPSGGKTEQDRKSHYFTHVTFNHTLLSSFCTILQPCIDLLNIKALIRIKCNLYPNTHILTEHGMHIDHDFSHNAAILSINTCDGYTKLEDGTKIDSIANRILFFDASKAHCSTTTTNEPVRVNINFNYF